MERGCNNVTLQEETRGNSEHIPDGNPPNANSRENVSMTEPQSQLNMRWFIPAMMICMGGFLFAKGPANSTAQLVFRVGTIVVGLALLVVLNLPKSNRNDDSI